MPRGRKHRTCRRFEGERVFKPLGVPMHGLPLVYLGLDELEAMRLCDVEGLDQSAAGDRMGVSRGTVQRLVKSGRAKVLTAVLESSALLIDTGTPTDSAHPPGATGAIHEDA
ncbi:MAG TPA: DUF134 domain-containing protein [Longimicrobiales bacterium]|nr:DUF134 domain-containing protein [Longimicrobiales bacterium]